MQPKYVGSDTLPLIKAKVPPVVQGLGDSTTAVMSQKAINDIVGNIAAILEMI